MGIVGTGAGRRDQWRIKEYRSEARGARKETQGSACEGICSDFCTKCFTLNLLELLSLFLRSCRSLRLIVVVAASIKQK